MRTRRTIAEREADINTKILFHKNQIEKLEAQKAELLTPPPAGPKYTMKMVMTQAKKQGIDPAIIAKKLKLTFEDTEETADSPVVNPPVVPEISGEDS